MDPGPDRFAKWRRPVSFVKPSSAASSSAATDKRAEFSTFLQGDGLFAPFVPHSSSLGSMSEEDIDRVLDAVRQQVLLRSGLQTDDVYEIQWVSAKAQHFVATCI